MPDGHCADPFLPLHLDQGRGSSKKESFSMRVSPALHPPERPSPRRADMAGHGHGSGDVGMEEKVHFGKSGYISENRGTFRKIRVQFWRRVDVAGYARP